MPYRLELLGRVQLLRDGRPVESFAGHRQKLALLAYLALQPDLRATRDRLLGVFWPDRDESSARHSLSELVYEIRREASDLVEATRASVGLLAGGFRCDALEFRAAAESGDHERAVELYGGNLLEGLSLSISPDFEHWAEAEQAQLLRLHRRVCRDRVGALRAGGELEAAIASVRRWLEADPFEDEAHRCLIELLYLSSDRSGALEQYERYVNLCREMEVEPLDDLLELVEKIRSGDAVVVREVPRADASYGAAAAAGAERTAALVFDRPPRGAKAIWREIRRRRVLEVAALYAGVAILAEKAMTAFLDRALLSEWVVASIYALLALGLPVVVFLAWGAGGASAVPSRGRVAVLTGERLPPGFQWVAAIRSQDLLGLLGLLAVGFVLLLWLAPPPPSPPTASGLDPRRVAVLQFDDLSEGQELEHLSAGFTQGLINELGRIEALNVISYNGIKPFRDGSLPVDSIAQRLSAGSLVEGGVARSGERLRLNVHLVDGKSGVTLETRTVERPRAELFALQDDLVREVSGFLRTRLGREIRLRERRAETASVEAWELVQRAEQAREEYTPLRRAGDTEGALRALERADSLLRQAESHDPAWAEPTVLRGWLAESKARLLSPTPGQYQERFARDALAHAERALRRSRGDPRALELRGTVGYRLSRQAPARAEAEQLLDAAERDLRAAVAANPSQASAWRALSALLHVGKADFAEAKRSAERAYEEDAFLADAEDIVFQLSQMSLELKQYEEAMSWAKEGQRRWPGVPDFHALELGVLASEGGAEDVDRAWGLVDAIARTSSPQRRATFVAIAELLTAPVLARAGLADSARAVIRHATARVPPDQLPWLAYDEASAWLAAADREQALRALKMHLDSEPQRRAYIAEDPAFEALRDDPRFQALVRPPN